MRSTSPTMFEARLIQGKILKKIMETVKDLVVCLRFAFAPKNPRPDAGVL
jgi:hypothetical protein